MNWIRFNLWRLECSLQNFIFSVDSISMVDRPTDWTKPTWTQIHHEVKVPAESSFHTHTILFEPQCVYVCASILEIMLISNSVFTQRNDGVKNSSTAEFFIYIILEHVFIVNDSLGSTHINKHVQRARVSVWVSMSMLFCIAFASLSECEHRMCVYRMCVYTPRS